MAIKQQGGVFGRNPTFNDVNIDKLTVDGSASVNGPLDCDGFTSNGQSNFVGTLGTVFVDSQGAFLNFTRNSGNYIRTTGASSSLYINTASTNRIGIFNTGDINLYKDDGTTVGATWDASAGNLAFASGNGIDFSATSGTGTSELFDDYEEGTWTPEITGTSTAGTIAYNAQHGYYTKIGRMVQVEFYVQWNSGTGTGNLQITGLPFTAGNNLTQPGLAIGDIENVALTAANVATLAVASNSTNINMRQVPTGGGGSSPVPYDAAGYIKASGVYSV